MFLFLHTFFLTFLAFEKTFISEFQINVVAVTWKLFDVFATLHLQVKLVNFPPNFVLSFSMWAIFILLCYILYNKLYRYFFSYDNILRRHQKLQIWWFLFVHPRCSRFLSTKSDVALKKYALRLPRVFNQRPTTLEMSFSAFSARDRTPWSRGGIFVDHVGL